MNEEELAAYVQTDEGKNWLETQKSGLINKNTELLGEIKKIKGETDTFRQAAERAQQEAADKIRKEEEIRLKASNDWDALKSHYEKQVADLTNNLQGVKQNLAKKEQDRVIAEVASREATVPKALQAILKERTVAEIKEDHIQLRVLDEDGQDLYVAGKAATVNDLVESLRMNPEYQPLFKGTGATGSGARQSENKGSTLYDMSSKDFNLTKAAMKAVGRK
jgi:hypothetical protein